VLIAHFYQQYQLSASLVMEPASPERTSVNIGDTVSKHYYIIQQLLAAHALTGCDTVRCYFGVGKVKSVKVMQAGHKLDSIGQPESEQAIVIREETKFIAACYGEKVGPDDNMSDIRYMQ
jgi:predicted aminopeptidase